MPNTYSRLNLASAIFPFYTQAAGRTIMVPESDENWDRYNAANTVQDKGVPQVFYMHNVVPLAGGFQSIGYLPQIVGLAEHTDFDTCFPIINVDGSNILFCPAGGMNYVFDATAGTWVSNNPISNIPANAICTVAYVQGVTYIYYSGVGCFTYDTDSKQIVSVTLTGLQLENIIGIAEASGYMVAYSSNALAWSSLTTATDFTPDIDTGAGGGNIQDQKGAIEFISGVPGGMIVYCEKNVVGGQYTANTGQPFLFQESAGSGGVESPDLIGYQGNLQYQVALTTAGLQQVSIGTTIPTMPEVSDFLTACIYEDFDETTLSLTQAYLSNQLAVKISVIGNRYIIVSYGPDSTIFTHAIVYDIGLNRYGKLKINHRCAFEFSAPTVYGDLTYANLQATTFAQLSTTTFAQLMGGVQPRTTPKQNLALMQEDGTIQLVDFSLDESVADGVFILGKLQFQRGNMMVHQRTDVETINKKSSFALWLLPTFNGKDFAEAVPTLQIDDSGDLTRTYAKRYTAKNISLCLIGAYSLSSLVLNFTIGGFR